MNKKLIEQLVSLIANLESLSAEDKHTLVKRLKYMPEWQLEKMKKEVISLHQEEEKFKSDVSRMELKYEMNLKKFIESGEE